MIYRIKQFAWALQSVFKSLDYNYVKNNLNEDEFKLFNKLSKTDKFHSIKVSKKNLKLFYKFKYSNLKLDLMNLNEVDLVKIGLLHDIGKIENPINIFEKSILVILDKITNGNLKSYDKIKKIDTYYNHPKKAIDILKKFNYSDEFIEAIEKHHLKESDTQNNKILYILKLSDESN